MTDDPTAQRIREARQQMRLTQTELAYLSGYSGGAVTMVEGGFHPVSKKFLAAVAPVLGLTVEQLRGEDPMTTPEERAYDEGHAEGYAEGYQQALDDLSDAPEMTCEELDRENAEMAAEMAAAGVYLPAPAPRSHTAVPVPVTGPFEDTARQVAA